MADAENHAEPKDDGLDTLPEDARKETEDIIKEIEKENNAAPPPPPEKPTEKTEEKPPKEDKAPDKPKEDHGDKPKEGDKKAPDEQSRKKGFVPVEKYYTETRALEGKITELQDELAKAAKGSAREQDKQGDDKKEQGRIDADLRKKTDAIAAKYGTDADEEYEKAEALRDALKTAPQAKVEIPKEIEDGFKEFKEYKHQQEVATEETLFNTDFDKKILPLVQAEYGKDVPESVIADVKDKVKAKAYSEEYGKVPMTTIYKGEDEFRGLIPDKQKGSEKSRGGTKATIDAEGAEKGDGPDLSGRSELSSTELEKLTGPEFDKYSDARAAYERSRK